MFLTCRAHPTRVESCLIAERANDESYVVTARVDFGRLSLAENLQKWINEHANCGGTFDHFTLSYENQKDVDLPSVPAAVHRALSKVE